MDVDDKTRFVFSDSSSDQGDQPVVSGTGQHHSQPENDATVFVGRENNQSSQDSYFSASPSVSVGGIAEGGSPDATILAQSINPSHVSVTAQKQPAPKDNTDTVVIKQRFELSDLLGVGGMGAVYKATDRRKLEANDSDPYVAIKVLNDDFRNHPDAFISLQREARKSQTLAHPNIVTVHDFDRDNEMVFMTMEFLEGAPLDALLRKAAGIGLPFEQAIDVLRDISNALDYAHSHNIVHSDFKPGNIFVTNNKGAKVFDFGIARAVKPGGINTNAKDDRTVFDAGSLGALTPAYASLEMLQGKDPAPSDDVYALACVAYELFAGKHPFNKEPADKARQQKLQPKRLKILSCRQWNALQKALAFERSKRTQTVEEFMAQFYGRTKLFRWVLAAGFLSLSAAGAAYMLTYNEQVVVEEEFKQELQQELQQEYLQERINDKRKSLLRVVAINSTSESWEQDVNVELEEFIQLAPEDLNTVAEVKQAMGAKFISAATDLLANNQLQQAQVMLDRATQWEASQTEVDSIVDGMDAKREEQRQRLETQRLAAEKRARQLEQQRARERQAAVARDKEKRQREALLQVENSLHCSFGMDIQGAVVGSMAALAKYDSAMAEQLRPTVAQELAHCFSGLAASNPPRVEPLLARARVAFPEQAVLRQFTLDYCAHLAPGSGGRGKRYSCNDRLQDGDKGPAMVVVKDSHKKKLAISKYEISFKDMAPFCQQTQACGAGSISSKLPATNISIQTAVDYADWLSKRTGHNYRVPQYSEWLAAAKVSGEREDPDRNCHLKYGAIQKGDELTSAVSGKANKYGLVNHVGNAQEWVRDGQQLLAVGGSRKDQMSRCLVTTKKAHSGQADSITGFRLVRSIK
ncbi:hypothetical protein R50073_30080 [Maricurvus nonylphenolicus]|uniref:protein kinase domain-containing protein n=1 Tax=Maricurvus nonylphenolicus TaxID=1008307 RepID=UPI0036F3A6B8